MKEIYFKTKVYPGNDNTLLPIVVTFEVSGTLRQLSTVFDFTQVSTSLKRVSEEILVDISTHLFSSSKKKRSIDTLVSETDTLLFSLKTYHNYCAKFTNYHELLYNVAQSLYNLAKEHSHIQPALTQSDYLADNFTNVISSSKFALGNGNYSHVVYVIATLSVYPHRASLKNMPGHGGIRTYDLWNASPMLCQLSYAVRSVRGYDISELSLVPSIPM